MSENLRIVLLAATCLCACAAIAGWFYGDTHKSVAQRIIDEQLKSVFDAVLLVHFFLVFAAWRLGYLPLLAAFFGYSELLVALGIIFMGPLLGLCHWLAALTSAWYRRSPE